MIAALFAGLIPPPLINQVATSLVDVAPPSGASESAADVVTDMIEAGLQAVAGLADAPAVALAQTDVISGTVYNDADNNGPFDAELLFISPITSPDPEFGQSPGASYTWLDAGATLSRGDVYMLEIGKNDGSMERTVIDVTSDGAIFLPLVAK